MIPGLERSAREENSYPLQYFCLENFTGRGAWQAWGHKELDMTETLTLSHRIKILKILCKYTGNWSSLKYSRIFILCGVSVCYIDSVVSDSLQPHGLWPARILLSMGFSRQELWSRLPCPPPGDLPNPGLNWGSPASEADSLPFRSSGKSILCGIGIKIVFNFWLCWNK